MLTKAEWAVMDALWQKQKQTLSGIIQTIGNKQKWKYNTYATYLNRMVDKGYVAFERNGRDKLYYPAINKQQCLEIESKEIREKIDHNSTKDFLVCMLKDSELTDTDKRELMALLETLS